MPKPSQPPQDPTMPSTPRTPTSKVLGARQSARAAVEDFDIFTPGAPRTPTRPLILHDPTSPTPMPMLRSRRGHTLPPFAQSIMGRGSESDQSNDSVTPKRNGVSIHDESDSKKARRQSSNGSQTPPRLIVSIPITTPTKRESDSQLDSVDEDRKHRRLSHNTRSRDISNLDPTSAHQVGSEDPKQTRANDQEGQGAERNNGNKTFVRTTRSRAAEMRTKLLQDGVKEGDVVNETVVDPQPVSEPITETANRQENEMEGQPEIDGPQVEGENLEDPEDADNLELNDVESDLEDGEDSAIMPENVRKEIEEFEQGFNGLQGKFKLLDKIGEGTFSSVYRAIDLEYDLYDNSKWEYELGKQSQTTSESQTDEDKAKLSVKPPGSETGKVVAIKRIYVTSSPRRIENEIAILHTLSGHKNVIPLITAFRFKDQVIAVLPYFEHSNFKKYFRDLPMDDIRCYFRALLSGLVHVHKFGIIHRDLKPTNFLFNKETKTGVIVDFGLAQYQKRVRPTGRSSRMKAAAAKQLTQSTTPSNPEKPINDTTSINNNLVPSKSEMDPELKTTPDPLNTIADTTPVTKDALKNYDSSLRNEQTSQNKPSTHQIGIRKHGQDLSARTGSLAPATSSVSAPMNSTNINIKTKNEILQPNHPDIAKTRRFDGNPSTANHSAALPTQPLSKIEGANNSSKIDLLQGKRDPTQARRRFEGPQNNISTTGLQQPIGTSTSTTASTTTTTTRQPGANSNFTIPNPLTQRTSAQQAGTPYGSPALPISNLTSQSRMKVMLATQHAIPGNPQMAAMNNRREPGYFKKDPRPEIHVNRAGTRGFRAPEVLFRHTQQTTALDIWAVGVILASFLTGRFPFFNSHDDADSLLEIAIVAGKIEMQKAAASFNRTFVTNIPTIRDRGLPMVKLCRVIHPERFNPPENYFRSAQDSNKSGDGSKTKVTDSTNQATEKSSSPASSDASKDAIKTAKPNEILTKNTPEANQVHRPNYSESHKSLVEAVGDIEVVDDIDMAIADENQRRSKAEAGANSDSKGGSSSSTKAHPHRVVGWDSQEDLKLAVNLLERLLDVNPKTRITASQALKHPFLAEKQSTS